MSDKKSFAIKRIQTGNLLGSTPKSYHIVTKTQVTDRFFKLTLIHGLMIY